MKQILISIGLLLLLLLLRVLIFPVQTHDYTVGEKVKLTHTIWDEPKRSQYSQRFYVDSLVISTTEYPVYTFGDTVKIEGVVEENEYTTKQGVEVTEKIIKNPLVTQVPSPVFLQIVKYIRETVITITKQTLPADEAALLLGITLGVRSEFSKEMSDMFTVTGIMHVVAASGSNVATVVGIILFSLTVFFKRQYAIILTGVVVVFYAVLSGFDPPIIRASIMAFITLTAQLLGRQNYSYYAFFLTVWIMLFVQPHIIFNVGFQLSVSATAGIVFLKPIIDHFFTRLPKIIADDLATTLAAQWTTIPILLAVFGTFAPLSIVVNMTILWVVPLLMILGLLASFLSLIFPVLATPVLFISYPFLLYFLTVIEWLEPFIYSLTISNFNNLLIASYYLFTASIYIYLRKRQYEKR